MILNIMSGEIHVAAVVVALLAVTVFAGSYLRRFERFRLAARLLAVVAVVVALGALLLVTSPLDYRLSSPAPVGTKLYVLGNDGDFYSLRATDGARTFIRHLPGSNLMPRYLADGQLIVDGPYGQDLPAQTMPGAGTPIAGEISTYTLRAFRASDGQDSIPLLGSRAHVTDDTLDQGILYVTTIDTPAHPEVETLYAFSMRMAMPLWQSNLPAVAVSRPQFCGSDSGTVYLLLGNTVVAVGASDGAIRWQSSPLWKPATLTYALECLAQPGGVYIDVSTEEDDPQGGLVKLRAVDGKVQWLQSDLYVLATAGERLYAVRDGKLLIARTDNGKPFGPPSNIVLDRAPLVLSTGVDWSAGVLYLLGRIPNAPVNFDTPHDVIAIRMSDGSVLWHTPISASVGYAQHPFLASGDNIFFNGFAGGLDALRAANGSVLWTHPSYSRSGFLSHWADTFRVDAAVPGVLFVSSVQNHPCQLLTTFGCGPDNGSYIEARDPASGRLFWRYHSEDVAGYLVSA